MQVKKNDFVELEYTGSLKEEGIVFDTTSEAEAKKAEIHNPQTTYKAAIICVGHKQLIKGMDDALEGVEVGKEQTVTISAEDGFGKKRADLIQLIATAKFRKHGIRPMPGLQVNIDNSIGVIKTVTGGRTLVDFNHPCAGKELSYTFTVKRVVSDDQEKVQALISQLFGEQLVDSVTVKDAKAEISVKIELPEEIQEKCTEKVKELIPTIKDVAYTTKQQDKA